MQRSKNDVWVGLFVVLGAVAVLFLALKSANLLSLNFQKTYMVTAKFDNIGGLKVRSPVKVGGVIVGRVSSIELDRVTYTPVVTLDINTEYSNFPETSSVAILTSGLLGEQYVGLLPGFVDDTVEMLREGDMIEDTRSAIVLEELIGQFLFNRGN